MSTEFLKTGFNNLRQVAAFVLFRNADGLFNLSFLQAAGNGWSKLTRLFTRLAESEVTIDHDADGPRGHDGKQDDDGSCRSTHVGPHGSKVETDLLLKQHHREKVKLNEKHTIKILLNPVVTRP